MELAFSECIAAQTFELSYALLDGPILDTKPKRYYASSAVQIPALVL